MLRIFSLLFIGCFLLPSFVSSQQSDVDSLRQVLISTEQDTTRLKTLYRLSWRLFETGDLEGSKKYANEVILLADSIKHPKPNWALQRKASGYSILGIIDCSKGNFAEAVDHLLKSLKIGNETGDTIGVANVYTTLGVASWSLGKYPEALKYYYSALAIYEKSGDTAGIGNANNNIGAIHEYLEEYDTALEHYCIALDVRLSINDKNGIAGAYNNIGNIYDYQGKYEASLENHFNALQLFQELKYIKGVAEVNDNIANTYSNMKKYDKEIQHRKLALSIEETLGDKLGIGNSYNNIGSSYYDQGKFEEAINYFRKGLAISKEIGAMDRIEDAYAGLAETSAGLNNYKDAYTYHLAYSLTRDSLINESNNSTIAEMKEKYEAEKKDARIEILHKDNVLLIETHRRKAMVRNILFAGGAILLFLLFLRYRDLQNLHIERIRNKISKDLHDDIGSTLSSISISSAVAQQMLPEQYPEILSTLRYIGESTRTSMENMSDIVWAINPKNDSFKNMMDRLQIFAIKILDAKNIRLQLEIPESLHHAKLSMPQRKNIYLILREAIHNVAKYSEASYCLISAEIIKKKIHLLIKDDGVGFNSVNAGLGGNGLINMKQRAEELNAAFYIHSEVMKGTSLFLQFKQS